MKLLLDTHILLWALAQTHRLTERARDLLIDPDNEKLASVISLWEVAIKVAARRGSDSSLPFDTGQIRTLVDAVRFEMLLVTSGHILALEALPLDRHRDPFDRMLVAQAIGEGRSC